MKKFNSLLIIAVAVSIAACNPSFYIPNTQNVPLLSEKGETNLTVSGNFNHVEFQGAYAASDHFAIKADAGFFIPGDVNGNGGSGKFFELGGGYFTPITENIIFETYGIFGFGSLENHFKPGVEDPNPESLGDISARVLRIGIQPNIGYKSKYFSIAASSRIVNLRYSKIEGNLMYKGESQITYLNDNASNFLIEPALTLKVGDDRIKFQLQYGYSYNLSNIDFRQDKTFVSIGVNFNFK